MDGAGVTEWLGHAARRLQEEAQCAGAEGGNGTAVNPNVFENEVGQLVGTSLLCFVVTCLAVAAGIGGGGLLVPLYAFVLGLGPKNAVPVSKATIFGGRSTAAWDCTSNSKSMYDPSHHGHAAGIGDRGMRLVRFALASV